MGFFDDIGKELEKALKPNSTNDSLNISKVTLLKKEYDDTIFYLNQVEKKKLDNGIDQATYDSLSLEYQQKKTSLLDQLHQYFEKYSRDKAESESVVKRSSFEKGEIYSQLTKNTSDYSNDFITEAEYQAKKKELETKSRNIDARFENAKKTLLVLNSISETFNEFEANKN